MSHRKVREGLSEEVTLELRPERQGRDDTQGARLDSKCKGPEVDRLGPEPKEESQ